MAGSLTRYGEQLILNLAFRNAQSSVQAPTTLYVGLTTAAIQDGDTMLEVKENEVKDANYRRASVTYKAPEVEGSITKITNIGGQIAFGPWNADSPVNITHCFITDKDAPLDDTTANVIAWMNLTVAKKPGQGDMLVFYEGDIKLTLN
jgi:hypothetical protein